MRLVTQYATIASAATVGPSMSAVSGGALVMCRLSSSARHARAMQARYFVYPLLRGSVRRRRKRVVKRVNRLQLAPLVDGRDGENAQPLVAGQRQRLRVGRGREILHEQI